MKQNVTMVCDLQFGSTGKGLISGFLAETERPDVAVTAWGPNAGHTYIDTMGRKFIHTMLANSIVSPNLKYILIGPGSMVNMESLQREIADATTQGIPMDKIKVCIHPHAAIVTEEHRALEDATMTGIGSTKKGSGEALISKLRRQPGTKAVAGDWIEDPVMRKFVISTDDYNDIIDQADNILMEGAQGYSLGVSSGFYPYVTSRECTTAQMASDGLIPIRQICRVVGTLRTFPIRVANRFNGAGEMVGYSGPGYADQEETSFAALGVETELTTVTKLPRRVFTFSQKQIDLALRMTGATDLFVNFANYLKDDEFDAFFDALLPTLRKYGASIKWVGVGPAFEDVITRANLAVKEIYKP